MTIVGIDIGGTSIKADLYQSDGRSLNQFREVGTEIDFEKENESDFRTDLPANSIL